MQKRRKTYVYGGVLALALLVLIIDRATRTAPKDVSAAEVPPPDKASASVAPQPTAPRVPEKDTPSAPPLLAARWLRDLPDVPEVRDLFAPSNLLPPQTQPAEDAPHAPRKDTAAAFARNHRLSATFRDGRSACAVVDGRVLRPGHELDGFRLISVDSFRATFVQGNLEAVLRLALPEQTSDGSGTQEQ